MNILFLGYDKTQTCLIDALKDLGHAVEHTADKVDDFSHPDLVVSYGYRHILRRAHLESAKRSPINLHIAYLPFNRGAHPNFWAFAEGTPHGVTIHEIDEGIDTGNILLQEKVEFSDMSLTFSETYQTLSSRIEALFLRNIDDILAGRVKPVPQSAEGTFHRRRDLPQSLEGWGQPVREWLDNEARRFQ